MSVTGRNTGYSMEKLNVDLYANVELMRCNCIQVWTVCIENRTEVFSCESAMTVCKFIYRWPVRVFITCEVCQLKSKEFDRSLALTRFLVAKPKTRVIGRVFSFHKRRGGSCSGVWEDLAEFHLFQCLGGFKTEVLLIYSRTGLSTGAVN